MKLLITGANGFIGKAMLRGLSETHEIYALVREPSNCEKNEAVQYIQHDFTYKLDIDLLPKNIDAIIHLAQSSQYRNFPDGMSDMSNVNISGLVDILDYARHANCQYFINFSSGSVYSTNPAEQTEESSVKPSSAYPLTKYISEQITDLYQPYFTTLNLRLFFPYGPGQENMLIPNIISSVRQGNEIGIQGTNGGLKICPIFVDDVVRVTSLCLSEQAAGIMNVAGHDTISLKSIAEHIATQTQDEPVFKIDSEAVPAEYSPSLTLMTNLLDGRRLTAFENGIKKTISS